jgi:hypothetical protein
MAPWIPPNSQPVPYCPQIGADADFRAPMDDLKQWLTRSRKLETRTA